MKEKLNLKNLKVKSFVTDLTGTSGNTVKGGGHGATNCTCPETAFPNNCDRSDACTLGTKPSGTGTNTGTGTGTTPNVTRVCTNPPFFCDEP